MPNVATVATDTTLLKRLLCPLSNFRLLTSVIAQGKDDVAQRHDAAARPSSRSPLGSGSGSDEENDPGIGTDAAVATPPKLTMMATSPPPPPQGQITPPPAAAAGVSPRAPNAISPSPRRRTRSCLAKTSLDASARPRRARTVSFVSDEDAQCKEVLGTALADVDRTSIATTAVESSEWEQLGGDWQKPDTTQLRQANAAWQVSQPLIAPASASRDAQYGYGGRRAELLPEGTIAATGAAAATTTTTAPHDHTLGPHDFVHVQWAMYVLMPARGGWVPCTALRYSPARRRVWVTEGIEAAAAAAKQNGTASVAPAPGDAGVLLQSSTCRLMECHEDSTISTFERLQLQIYEEVNGRPNSAAISDDAEEEQSRLISSKRRSLTYPPPDGSRRTKEAARLAIKRARMLEIEARSVDLANHQGSLQEPPRCRLATQTDTDPARLRSDMQHAAGGASFMG